MAPHAATIVVPDHTSVLTADGEPTWDGNPLYLSLYLTKLTQLLPTAVKGSRLYLERRYTISRKVRVYSAEQASTIVANTATTHTIEKPCPLPARTATALPGELEARFELAPEANDGLDGEIADYIESTISDKVIARDLAKTANRSGAAMITELYDRKAKLSTDVNTTIHTWFTAVKDAGIAEPTLTSFNTFYSALTEWNSAQVDPHHKKDPDLAIIIADAMRDLGTNVEQKFDMTAGLTTAAGDLVKTVTAARKVLGDISARSARTAGSALRAVSSRRASRPTFLCTTRSTMTSPSTSLGLRSMATRRSLVLGSSWRRHEQIHACHCVHVWCLCSGCPDPCT